MRLSSTRHSRTKFQVDRATGDLLLAGIENPADAYAVGLTVKSGTRPFEVTCESLYKTGNLFRISHVQPADDGYLICAEVVERVRAVSLSEKHGQFYATFEPVPDLEDLEEDLRIRILADVKSHYSRYQQPLRGLRTVHQADRPYGICRPDHGFCHALPASQPE